MLLEWLGVVLNAINLFVNLYKDGLIANDDCSIKNQVRVQTATEPIRQTHNIVYGHC